MLARVLTRGCRFSARLVVGALVGLLVGAGQAMAAPLLLSGEVSARHSEVFVAPEGDNWIMQIEWMVEEGERVNVGDPVVQYDTASITSKLEQREATLRKVKAQSKQKKLALDLALREAQHGYDVATLGLEIARLNASIPQPLLSLLDYEQYQLAFTRQLNAQKKAANALVITEKNGVAERRRSEVEVAGAKNELQRAQRILDLLTQRATSSGTAMYMLHAWTQKKIRTGDSVRRGFSVLQIPATDNLHIKAWLNEIDVTRVREGQAVQIQIDARPDTLNLGKVAHMGTRAEPRQYWGEANYIEVDIELDNASTEGLLPGMSVMVEVLEATP